MKSWSSNNIPLVCKLDGYTIQLTHQNHPADFDPENYAGVCGCVTGVDLPGSAFTLEDKDGQATTVNVNPDTTYRGQVTGLADLQVGMLAQAITEKQANGDLLAQSVRAGTPADQRFLGKVTAVDADSFTIQTRKGETLTFAVAPETVFLSRKGLVDSLDDLKAGMPVAVGANDLGTASTRQSGFWQRQSSRINFQSPVWHFEMKSR